MYIPIIKSIVLVLAVLEVWLLLQVPVIGDAVFSFVVGGELPGSDRVLSMRQIVLLLTGLFILAAGVLFHKEINRVLDRIGRRSRPVPQPAPVVTAPQVPQKKIARQRPARLRPALQHIAVNVRAGAIRLRSNIRRGSRQVQKAIIWFCAMEVYLAYRLWIAHRVLAVRLWRWSRPYMERCDRWVDRKLHQNELMAGLLDVGSDLAATIREWAGRLRSIR